MAAAITVAGGAATRCASSGAPHSLACRRGQAGPAASLGSMPAHAPGRSSLTLVAAPRRAVLNVSASAEGDGVDPFEMKPAPGPVPSGGVPEPTGPRDDDVLPDSLDDALAQASEATVLAMRGGGYRAVVEILIPELWDPISGFVMADEGDNIRLWDINRAYVELVVRDTGKQVRMVVPDAGQAAYLKNQWPDASFEIASLSDRKIVQDGDGVVVVASPDPQGLEAVKTACKQAAALAGEDGIEEPATVVLLNPRLASGDVGIGLNVRRMRDQFMTTFITTYSLRPLEEYGTVFRRYPDMWKVFLADMEMPGRFKLIAERPSRPAGEVLENIIMAAAAPEGEDGEVEEPGLIQQVMGAASSMARFMNSLSK